MVTGEARWHLCLLRLPDGTGLWLETARPLDPGHLLHAWATAAAAPGPPDPVSVLSRLASMAGFRHPIPDCDVTLAAPPAPAPGLAEAMAGAMASGVSEAGPDPTLPLAMGPYSLQPNASGTAWLAQRGRYTLCYELERDMAGTPIGGHVRVYGPHHEAMVDTAVGSRAEAEAALDGWWNRL